MTPFAQHRAIRNQNDVRLLEQTPLEQAYEVRSTYELLRTSAAHFGERTAIVFLTSGDPSDDPIRWTYSDLLRGVHRTANLLHTLGVRNDDTVAVLMPACPEHHLAFWGGEAAGIVQPLNPLLSDDKLVALMNAARAKVLIAWGADEEAGYWTKALRVRERVPGLAHLIRVEPHGECEKPELPPDVIEFASATVCEPDDQLRSGRKIAPSETAAYFHTGGTTGAPRLARHSHGAQVFSAWASVQMQGVGPDDVLINGYPLFHVAGVLPVSLASLAAGATMVIPTTTLMRNREVIANYWRLVAKYRATAVSAVPTVLAALAQVPLDGVDISSVRYCRTGASPLPPELAARFERLTGLHVHESLGMTETAGILTITPPGVVGPAGCVGFPLPYVRLRIVALDTPEGAPARDLPPGERGMLLCRSPNLFSGFVDTSDNAGAFTDDGWLVTGDIGWMDAEGRLNLSGRAKDLIIRGGHNIDPKVIEDALTAHPAVHLAAAVGAPDAYAGELPVAFVALKPGHTASEDELTAFAAAHVDEAPARPRRVSIVEQMPLTNVGKIYKPQLRALAARDVAVAVSRQLCADQAPAVSLDGERIVVEWLGQTSAETREALRAALARLPIVIEWRDLEHGDIA
jgi:fatty-acyl-CoA synthase